MGRYFLAALVLMPLLTQAATVSWQTDAHHISVDPQDGSVSDWIARSAKFGEERLTLPPDSAVSSGHFRVRLDESIFPSETGYDVRQRFSEDGLIGELRAGPAVSGLEIRKSFEIPQEGYRVTLTLSFTNHGERKLVLKNGATGAALLLGPGIGPVDTSYEGFAAYLYAFVNLLFLPESEDEIQIAQLDPEQPSAAVEIDTSLKWAALNSRYILLAVLAEEETPFVNARIGLPGRASEQIARVKGNPQYGSEVALSLPIVELDPGEVRTFRFQIYGGLKDLEALDNDSFNLTSVAFYSLWDWMRYLCFAILWILHVLSGLVGNLGLAIVLLAVVVRILLYPIARTAARQQAEFRERQVVLAPLISEIKAKYKGGEEAERIFELYRQHDVSPMAGLKSLFVVLLQIPVFVALFHILGQAIEFRGIEFLWMSDLARPDGLFTLPFHVPYFGSDFHLLPVLMGVTSLATMYLSGGSTDSRGQYIVVLLVNVGFFVLFYHFPAGMVLYWVVANILQLTQQIAATHRRRGEVA